MCDPVKGSQFDLAKYHLLLQERAFVCICMYSATMYIIERTENQPDNTEDMIG